MFHSKTNLLLSITLLLGVLFLSILLNPHSSETGSGIIRGSAYPHPALEATIQILLIPADTMEILGIGQDIFALREALSRTDAEYYFERGLGTLVSDHGELLLITHDHWGALDHLGAVQFLNANGDPLLEMHGETFKSLIRYQDNGTMILGRTAAGNLSYYLPALISISRSNSNRRVVPAELGRDEEIHPTSSLVVVRKGRDGSNEVELLDVSVEAIGEQWGRLVYQLRCAQGDDLRPGDSGGGLWLRGRLVGNMWKSDYTYRWDWRSLSFEKDWAETSYAAGLPELGEQFFQSLGAVNPNVELQEQKSMGEL